MTDYAALVRQSEMLRRGDERVADQAADDAFGALPGKPPVGAAAEQLQAAYDLAAARHFDRCAAASKVLRRHWSGPGDAYATHALRWLAEHGIADDPLPRRRETFTGDLMAAKRAVAADAPPRPGWGGSPPLGASRANEMAPSHPNTSDAEMATVAQPEKATDRYVIVRDGWEQVKH